jgi:endonuclease G
MKPSEIDSMERVKMNASHRNVSLEQVIGDDNLLSIRFLKRGVAVSKSVCCINVNGKHVGTGFLVGPRMLMTNAHVIPDVETANLSTAEFNFEDCVDGHAESADEFSMCPDELFVSSPQDQLDYSLIAIRPLSNGGARKLEEFSYVKLDGREGKALLGASFNIIQHPGGGLKQVALRENFFTNRSENHLHYETDTLPGSSGSPVFNDQWDVVCLHHGACTGHPCVNEGVRISRIVADIYRRSQALSKNELLVNFPKIDPINLGEKKLPDTSAGSPRRPKMSESVGPSEQNGESPINDGASATTVTIPFTVTISIGNVSKVSATYS